MILSVLSIAGSDPSGGAGIQADIKAICANGGYAMAVVTALTVQNTQGVAGVAPVAPDSVKRQIEAILSDMRVDAIKIGMLGHVDVVKVVAACLEGISVPVVLDPVLASTSGASLLDGAGRAALLELLLPRVSIVTPNLPEAAVLLGCDAALDREEMCKQAEAMRAYGPDVLLKGGHLPGEACADLLVSRDASQWYEAKRVSGRNSHGTGCTLSSALACQLAAGEPLTRAVQAAKDYTLQALIAGQTLNLGTGKGPLDHFFAMRSQGV